MNLLFRHAKKYSAHLSYYFRCRLAKVNETPVFVLGNQKSGTSAFAHLLADIGGMSKTIDIPPMWGIDFFPLMSGKLDFKSVVKRHKLYFATELIKEPNLTFVAGQVIERFPGARYLFIVRDPRENIRSMLNRMEIPGHLKKLDDSYLTTPVRRYLMDPCTWGGEAADNYVGAFAHKWNLSVDNYLRFRDRIILARYEDFLVDKYTSIREIAQKLNITPKFDISEKLDIQFQPRGNRNITPIDFFGEENLQQIETICSARMQQFGYAETATINTGA